MIRQLTSEQKEKILAVKRYLEIVEDSDCLHSIVIILGICFFGSIIGRRAETVWRRIQNPGEFRYKEMKLLSSTLGVTIIQIVAVIERQIEGNESSKKKYGLTERHK